MAHVATLGDEDEALGGVELRGDVGGAEGGEGCGFEVPDGFGGGGGGVVGGGGGRGLEGGGGGAAAVGVGVRVLFEDEAALLERGDDGAGAFGGDEDVVGEVGGDKEDWAVVG